MPTDQTSICTDQLHSTKSTSQCRKDLSRGWLVLKPLPFSLWLIPPISLVGNNRKFLIYKTQKYGTKSTGSTDSQTMDKVHSLQNCLPLLRSQQNFLSRFTTGAIITPIHISPLNPRFAKYTSYWDQMLRFIKPFVEGEHSHICNITFCLASILNKIFITYKTFQDKQQLIRKHLNDLQNVCHYAWCIYQCGIFHQGHVLINTNTLESHFQQDWWKLTYAESLPNIFVLLPFSIHLHIQGKYFSLILAWGWPTT